MTSNDMHEMNAKEKGDLAYDCNLSLLQNKN